MDAQTIEAAAQHLMAARTARRPGARLPAPCRPADAEAGLAIQRRVGEMLDLIGNDPRTGRRIVARGIRDYWKKRWIAMWRPPGRSAMAVAGEVNVIVTVPSLPASAGAT